MGLPPPRLHRAGPAAVGCRTRRSSWPRVRRRGRVSEMSCFVVQLSKNRRPEMGSSSCEKWRFIARKSPYERSRPDRFPDGRLPARATTAASGQGADTAQNSAFSAGLALVKRSTLDSAEGGRIPASHLPRPHVRHVRSFIRCSGIIFAYREGMRQSYFPQNSFQPVFPRKKGCAVMGECTSTLTVARARK